MLGNEIRWNDLKRAAVEKIKCFPQRCPHPNPQNLRISYLTWQREFCRCVKLRIFFFFFFLATLHSMWGLSFLTQSQTHAPLHWKHRVLTTGPLVKTKWSHSVVSDSATPWTVAYRLLRPWDFPGKSPGVGCHFLLQRIFLTQGSNLGLPRCR